MVYSPLLPVHVTAGMLGIMSGAGAMVFRKGGRRHVLAGKVFVASMLTMSTAAVYLAIVKDQTPNILAGILTFYLIITAWLTARRREGESSRWDRVALLIPLVGGSWVWFIGLEKVFSATPPADGVPAGMAFFVGSVMLLAAAGDIRMMLRGLSRTKRVVRHLWRMCFGLFIATGSFFLGQQQVFPKALRGSPLLVVLAVLPLPLLIFWLIRVRFVNAYDGQRLPAAGGIAAVRT